MNGEHPTQELLQRDLDGELSSNERAQLRSHVADCETCARRQAAQRRLQQLVAVTVNEQAEAVDLSRMFQNIEAGIAADTAEARPNGADGKASVVLPLKQPVRKVRRFTSVAPVAGALALAAAVMLMVYRSDNIGDSDDGAYETDGGRSEVTDIEFGRFQGDVIDIPLSNGSSTPVVWINDDNDDDEE